MTNSYGSTTRNFKKLIKKINLNSELVTSKKKLFPIYGLALCLYMWRLVIGVKKDSKYLVIVGNIVVRYCSNVRMLRSKLTLKCTRS